MEHLDIDPEWFVRDLPELQEKLPLIARTIVGEEIDFQQLEHGNIQPEVLGSVLRIVHDHVECLSEMTADEVDHMLSTICAACHITCMMSKGCVEKKDGKYYLTNKGREHYEHFKDNLFCHEKDNFSSNF